MSSFSLEICTRWFSIRAGISSEHSTQSRKSITYFHLSIGPSRNLNDHVQDGVLLIGIQRNIVEGRDRLAIFGDVDAVLQGVWSSDLMDTVP